MNVSEAIAILEQLPMDAELLVWERGGWQGVAGLESNYNPSLLGEKRYVLIHAETWKPFPTGG